MIADGYLCCDWQEAEGPCPEFLVAVPFVHNLAENGRLLGWQVQGDEALCPRHAAVVQSANLARIRHAAQRLTGAEGARS